MADINKNTTITNQYYSTAGGPLDAKLTPAGSYAELKDMTRIPLTQRYVGLTVTVLNSETTNIPLEYWLVGGVLNRNWKIKTNVVPTKAALLTIDKSACVVGLEMVVQADETNGGRLSKYWVTAVNSEGVTWERKEYGAGVTVDGEDAEDA